MIRTYAKYGRTIEELARLAESFKTAADKTVTPNVLGDSVQKIDINSVDKFNKAEVMEALESDGLLLEYACEELKDDEDVVYKALCKNVAAFGYASDRLRSDREFILASIGRNYLKIRNAMAAGNQDEAFRLFVSNYSIINYASHELRGDKAFVYSVLSYCDSDYTKIFANRLKGIGNEDHWHPLEHLNYKLRDDEIIALMALRLNMRGFEYASSRIQHLVLGRAC